MDIAQALGMLITFFVILYSLGVLTGGGRKKRDGERKREFDQEVDQYLKKLEGFGDEDEDLIDEEIEEIATSRPPLPRAHKEKYFLEDEKKKFAFRSSLEEYRIQSTIEERKLGVDIGLGDELVSAGMRAFGEEGTPRKKKTPPINLFFHKLSNKRMAVIASEVIQPPVSLRKKIYFQ